MDEERLSKVAAGHQQKMDLSVQKIQEWQDDMDANAREIAKQKERKQVLDQQAKKASADRQKGLQSQSAQVRKGIARYERDNAELRGLQAREKEKQKIIAGELDAANQHFADRRKDVKQAQDIVDNSKSKESTAQKRFEEYNVHLDGVIQDLADLLETMALIGRDGDVIEPVAEIVRGHRRLMAAVAKSNGKELESDDELDDLVGAAEPEDDALIGDVHEDIGEGWVRIIPADGGKPYYANTEQSKSQYAMPKLLMDDATENAEQMMLVPAVAVPGDVPGAMNDGGDQDVMQAPPHEVSEPHEEHRIVLPKLKNGGFGLSINEQGYVLSQEDNTDPQCEVRPGTKITAVNGVPVADKLDIGEQFNRARKQVELTVIPWHASGWAPASSKFSRVTEKDEDERKYKLKGHQKVMLERRDVFRGVARSALDLGRLYGGAPRPQDESLAIKMPEHDRALVKALHSSHKPLFAPAPGELPEGPPNWVDGSRARKE
eukprot:COSAG02_NODE_7603_length_2938_cov_3.353293_2_plen_490_part_00